MIKRIFMFTLLCIFLLIMGGCSSDDVISESPNALSPSFMAGGNLYYNTGRAVAIDATESEYIGKIMSVVPLSEMPEENNQANIPYEGAPYIKYEEGLALLMDGEWIMFEIRKEN